MGMFTYCRGSSGRPTGSAAPPMRGTLSGSAALLDRRVCVQPEKVSPAPAPAVPPSPVSGSMPFGAAGKCYSGAPDPSARYRPEVRFPTPRLPCGSAARRPQLPSSAAHLVPIAESSWFYSSCVRSPDWIPPTLQEEHFCCFRRGEQLWEKCWQEFGTMQITLLSSLPSPPIPSPSRCAPVRACASLRMRGSACGRKTLEKRTCFYGADRVATPSFSRTTRLTLATFEDPPLPPRRDAQNLNGERLFGLGGAFLEARFVDLLTQKLDGEVQRM